MNEQYYLSKAMCELMNIIIDPIPIIKFLKTKEKEEKTIQENINSLSLKELNELWNILKISKYSKDPKSILKELQINLRACIKR